MDHSNQQNSEDTRGAARRIVVIGTSCVGKTTLARRLADRLGCPHLELDAIHWGPDWTPRPRDQIRQAVDEQSQQPTWVSCGNYTFLRDILWQRADTIVWLNYSFPVVVSRALRRTLRRSLRREELWNGNRESLHRALLTRDSILLWVLTSYGRNRREIRQALQRPEFARLRVHELIRPNDVERLVGEVAEWQGGKVAE